MKTFCISVLLLLLLALNSGAQTQSNNTALTNKDIIDLVRTGLLSEVIVAKIKNPLSNFDTSPAALQELKAVNLPDLIILAMVQAPSRSNEVSTNSSEKTSLNNGVKDLSEVHKIYIGYMGKSDDSERFHLLAKELSEHGFIMVDKTEEADGIMRGVLATQSLAGTTEARAVVSLAGC